MAKHPGLIPALDDLWAEFDEIAPNRDKASDGWVGDKAHQKETSDHNWDETGSVPIHDADKVNEVHAIDVDNNLNESDLTMEKVVQFLLARCRSGAEKRLRYIIWNKRIWSASSDWVQKTYTGASPHTEHAHFSASYTTTLEANTASWHLGDIPVALTSADKTWIINTMNAAVGAAAASPGEVKTEVTAALREMTDDIAKAVVSDYRVPGTNTEGSTYQRSLADLVGDAWFIDMVGTTKGHDAIPGTGAPGQTLALLAEISKKLDALAAK